MSLTPPSQLLLRNQALFEDGKLLLVNPTDAEIVRSLNNPQLQAFCQFYDHFLSLSLGDEQRHFAAFTPDVDVERAVIYLPKSKAHLHMLLADVARRLPAGAELFLVGENKGGIKSAGKLLASVCDQVHKVDSAKHCSLWVGTVKADLQPFSEQQWLETQTLVVNDQAIQVCSLPGVFSHGELDPATALLLAQDYSALKGPMLDFGCGCGVIGTVLSLQHPQAQFVLADVSALALYSAQKTLQANQVQTDVIPCNGWQGIDGRFNGIFTNPPFHTGIKTDYGVAREFIQQAKAHLLPGGQLVLVANHFLDYRQQLQQHLRTPDELARTPQYVLYRA